MKLSRLFSAGFLLIVVAAMAVAVPALAHRGNPYARAETAKHKSGPWSETSQRIKVGTGHKKSVYIRLKNITSGPERKLNVNLTEAGQGGPPEYHNAWFRGKNDITHDVHASGHDFFLKPGETKLFRVRITAHDDSAQECVFAHFSFEIDMSPVDMFNGFAVNGHEPCTLI